MEKTARRKAQIGRGKVTPEKKGEVASAVRGKSPTTTRMEGRKVSSQKQLVERWAAQLLLRVVGKQLKRKTRQSLYRRRGSFKP